MKTITIKKILVPVDFSDLSGYAIEYAVEIAKIPNLIVKNINEFKKDKLYLNIFN